MFFDVERYLTDRKWTSSTFFSNKTTWWEMVSVCVLSILLWYYYSINYYEIFEKNSSWFIWQLFTKNDEVDFELFIPRSDGRWLGKKCSAKFQISRLSVEISTGRSKPQYVWFCNFGLTFSLIFLKQALEGGEGLLITHLIVRQSKFSEVQDCPKE